MAYLTNQIGQDEELVKTKNGQIGGLKVLFLGLSQSGKSSIIRVIFDNYTPESTKDLTATVNFNREKLNYSGVLFQVVDVGGQIHYIEEVFLNFKESVFSNVKQMIFVVDSSNFGEFLTAREYFFKSLKYIHDYNTNAKVCLLVHKIDLIPEKERSRIIESIKQTFETDNLDNIEIYETSIYEESIFDVMKKLLID